MIAIGSDHGGYELKKFIIESLGEEKFINEFLRKSEAGSGISLNGIKLPYGPLSVGGGDCEHGGIFYTLLKKLQSAINFIKIGKSDYGMVPVPFAVVTALLASCVVPTPPATSVAEISFVLDIAS